MKPSWVDPVYDVTFSVLQCPFTALGPVITRLGARADLLVDEPKARTLMNANLSEVVFWFPPEAKAHKEGWPNTIAHEAVHGACCVLRDRGLKIKPASEEALCYYVGYLVEEITRRLK